MSISRAVELDAALTFDIIITTTNIIESSDKPIPDNPALPALIVDALLMLFFIVIIEFPNTFKKKVALKLKKMI